MKIDAWTHLLSPAYKRAIEAAGPDAPGTAPFLLATRALHDIDYRLELMDQFGEYRQILTPVPAAYAHVQRAGGRALIDLVRRNNDDMAEIVSRHTDRFVGFAAGTALADPDAATEEAVRAVRELGALGVQLEEDANNLPLHEDRYDPLFAAIEDLDAAIWLHPFRTPATPGMAAESSPFILWQVFTWVFDTTITISRLVLAGVYDRHPRLKLIAHHGGAMIPHFSGRIEMIPAFIGIDPHLKEALERLKRPPIEYFKMLYVDTAMFGSAHGVRCVVDFFGPDHVLFGTDTPFDLKGGARFIPVTIADVEAAVEDAGARSAIFEGNARRLLNVAASAFLSKPRGANR
jgi:predicted TIM-barrel fold metal-dependent hydrolase